MNVLQKQLMIVTPMPLVPTPSEAMCVLVSMDSLVTGRTAPISTNVLIWDVMQMLPAIT